MSVMYFIYYNTSIHSIFCFSANNPNDRLRNRSHVRRPPFSLRSGPSIRQMNLPTEVVVSDSGFLLTSHIRPLDQIPYLRQ